MGWNRIKGQERVLVLLRRAIEQERLPQAYLFLGPAGVGKKLTALALARALNCAEGGSDFCDHCPACRKIARGVHPDVLLLEAEQGAKIKIEQVRRLQEEIAYKPFEGRWKVWIIDQAQELTAQAANCLLKTLEEPPGHSLLILIAPGSGALLATVVSRCQHVRFSRLSVGVVRELLQEQGITGRDLQLGSALAQGGLSGIDREFLQRFQQQRELMLETLERGGISGVFALADKLDKQKEEIEGVLASLNFWYRDLLLLKLDLAADLLVNGDKLPRLRQQAEALEFSCIQERLQSIQQALSELRYNANPRLVLENVLLEINPYGEKGGMMNNALA